MQLNIVTPTDTEVNPIFITQNNFVEIKISNNGRQIHLRHIAHWWKKVQKNVHAHEPLFFTALEIEI